MSANPATRDNYFGLDEKLDEVLNNIYKEGAGGHMKYLGGTIMPYDSSREKEDCRDIL